MDCSTLGFPVLHQLPKLAQTHVHWVPSLIKALYTFTRPFPQHLKSTRLELTIDSESESEFAQSCTTLCDPRDCSPTRLLCPWGFSKQEYWSGLPFPSPADLPDPGIKPGSPTLQADALPPGRCLSHQRNSNNRKVSPDPLPQHTV